MRLDRSMKKEEDEVGEFPCTPILNPVCGGISSDRGKR